MDCSVHPCSHMLSDAVPVLLSRFLHRQRSLLRHHRLPLPGLRSYTGMQLHPRQTVDRLSLRSPVQTEDPLLLLRLPFLFYDGKERLGVSAPLSCKCRMGSIPCIVYATICSTVTALVPMTVCPPSIIGTIARSL